MMKLKEKQIKDLSFLIEKWYPFTISFIMVVFYVIIRPFLVGDDLDNILNAVISFTSILLGFIGVLITLIFSLLNLTIVGNIFECEFRRNLMYIYFKRCIQSGFALITFTILLYFRKTINHYIKSINVIEILKAIWVFLTPYFTISSYRIITLVLQASFIPKQEDKDNCEDTKSDHTELRNKYKIN